MKNTLNNLEKVSAYTVRIPINEYEINEIGIYNTHDIASQKAKGAGWYNADGTVKQLENIYIDDEGVLYRVEKLGVFTDVKEAKEEKLLASVTAKLTAEELEFVKNKLK